MNFFDFFELEKAFFLDEAVLKTRFYTNSKKYHPDFYVLESDEAQQEALRLSTMNNEAYKVLSDIDLRVFYILDLEAYIEEEGKNNIPQDFLMEMMEVNEQMMEIQMDYSEVAKNNLINELEIKEKELLDFVLPVMKAYDSKEEDVDLTPVKEYYFKKKYLLRIRENLDKFARAL